MTNPDWLHLNQPRLNDLYNHYSTKFMYPNDGNERSWWKEVETLVCEFRGRTFEDSELAREWEKKIKYLVEVTGCRNFVNS